MHELKTLLVLPTVQYIDEIISGITTPLELTKGQYSNLEFRFKNYGISLVHSGVDIKDFSNVWLSSFWKSRDLAYAVNLYLEHFETAHTFVEKSTSKVTDQVTFVLNNISTPNTFFVANDDVSQFIDTIEDICGYPLIIKDITGARGENSVLVNDRIELLQKSAQLPKTKKYLYQQFIANDYDWGVLVANGKIVSAEKSYPVAGEFRNNCKGATEVYVDLELIPRHIQDIALNASAALGLNWSRSDIVVDRNTEIAYLMEVNRSPGISKDTMEVLGARDFLEAHLQTKELTSMPEQIPIIVINQLVEQA